VPRRRPSTFIIDADERQLGLGADHGGLTTAEARRVAADIDGAAEVVAPTIADLAGFRCSVREPEQIPHDSQPP
jgi:hypothetical protein